MTIDWSSGLLTAAIFLGVPALIMTFIAQWQWAKTCREKIKILEIKQGGGSDVKLVYKEGGEVTITNPSLGITRTWAINQLATIPLPYPELGILPRFLQREIQTVILHEGDWEPVLNRSPHIDNVISPNVVQVLLDLKEKLSDDELALSKITNILEHATTSPTREMIADPAMIGALKQNTIMKALASVSDDLVESIKSLKSQLTKVAGLNPTLIYLGLFAAIAVGVANTIILTKMDLMDITAKVNAIYNSLGIVQ